MIEKEVERLDREWLVEREKYKVSNSNGASYYPKENTSKSNLSGFIMIALALIFGIIMGVAADIDNKSQELQSEFLKKQNFETYDDWKNNREKKHSKNLT